MSETAAATYASLAGVEVVNNTRTMSYLQNGLGPSSLTIYGGCSTCEPAAVPATDIIDGNDPTGVILDGDDPTGDAVDGGDPDGGSTYVGGILELLGCPGIMKYTDPVTDNAPWYNSDVPESADFLGFFSNTFEGLNSPFTRDVKQSIGNGGVLGRGRLATRELNWKGYLFGKTCCSVRYGYQWLTRALARMDTRCNDCFGDDLEILVCCPDVSETVPHPTNAFRTAKGVGLIEGPLIISERATCSSGCSSGCSGSCILEIEFTLAASQPYLYSPPIPVYNCIPFSEGTLNTAVDPDAACPPFDCIDPMFTNASSSYFGLCSPNLPPTTTYQNSCFDTLVASLGPAVYLTVPRSLWPILEEVVPVITISNDSGFSNPGVRIGFYKSSDGNPCGDLFSNPPNCDVLCDELLVGPIPPNSSFYIDGRTHKMSIICEGGTAFAAEKITNGPWSWPTFNNYGFCMEVQFVNINTAPAFLAPEMCVSLSLIPRTF